MKCSCFECRNYSENIEFIGEFCKPCYTLITTGKISAGSSFIHDLVNENNKINKMIDAVAQLMENSLFEARMLLLDSKIGKQIIGDNDDKNSKKLL